MEKDSPNAESPPVSPASTTDQDGDGLTLFEKKCLLINREIDANGMGRYQW